MKDLMDELQKSYPEIHYRSFVDNARVIDRGSAWRAGLGFYGKNNTLINPEYGSAFFIGQILMDQPVDFVPAVPMESQCGECTRCLKACPNGALKDGYSLDASSCISYLTQKKKLTETEEKRLRIFIYGCDLCELACPYNQKQEAVEWKDNDWNAAWVDLKKMTRIDEETFNDVFGESALHWRGRENLIRNAKLLLNILEKEC